MAILDIKTSNKNISWIIRKNPITQEEQGKPFQRALRQGIVYGWYNNELTFRLFFKDGEGKSSFYKNLNNDYLDQSAYNCSYTYCSMLNEMLSATVKEKHEKDIDTYNSVALSTVLITLPHLADSFIKYFEEKVSIKMIPISKKVFNITFEGNVSLYFLLNLVQIFCLIQSLEDKNIYIDLSESSLKKYAMTLNNIEAPYFIVYLFLSRCMPDASSFNIVKKVLEKDNWVLNYGNTQKQRFNEIKKHIQKGNVLHDLGCGELYYSRNLSSYYNSIYSWDADEKIQQRNQYFINYKGLTNISLKDDFNGDFDIDIPPETDLLITEMLEHMPKENATQILIKLKDISFRKLIITVPNKDFNEFYKLESEFRHADHYWEPTYQETIDWIDSIFGKGYAYIKPIGDGVNGKHVSTLIVIEGSKNA